MSSVESYVHHETPLDIVPVKTYEDYLFDMPPTETGDGYYDLLCAAMQSDKIKCVVRKNSMEHSDKPEDWLVVRDDGDKLIEDVILAAKTIKGTDGDTIELMLAPDVDYHGPYILRFSVNPMYGPDNSEITLSHPKYYGRGVDVEPEEFVDMIFDESILENQRLADVIPIEIARERRQKMQDVGHTALVN
jgi:hypothetical protein